VEWREAGLGTGDRRDLGGPLLGRGLAKKIGGGKQIESVATVLTGLWVQRKGLGADGENEKGRVAPGGGRMEEGDGVSGGASLEVTGGLNADKRATVSEFGLNWSSCIRGQSVRWHTGYYKNSGETYPPSVLRLSCWSSRAVAPPVRAAQQQQQHEHSVCSAPVPIVVRYLPSVRRRRRHHHRRCPLLLTPLLLTAPSCCSSCPHIYPADRHPPL